MSLEIQLEAVIERVWRYTWKPLSIKIGGVLEGGQSGGGKFKREVRQERRLYLLVNS